MGALPKSPVPPYLKRAGFKSDEFGDGGAFPEIHYAQYPPAMGRRSSNNPRTLPLTVDDGGNSRYDAIVMQGENANKIVFTQYTDLVPIFVKDGGEEEDMDVVDEKKQKEIDETTQETKAVLEKIVNVRLSCAQPKNVPQRASSHSKFIKYKPSGAKQRIIRMVEMGVDPLEPPKFKHKRVPKPSSSQPVPVMQSPPRPVTVKDLQDWKIPPCISNWKNPKGYTIPLDKRLAADGRGLQDVEINGNFAMLSEALYVGEQISREAVAARSKVKKEMVMREKEMKDLELRELARKARSGRSTTGVGDCELKEENEEKLRRDEIREEQRRARGQKMLL
ncbi:chromatin protein family [Perilla frutescens var. frutescens]|nr:chromatin protein family [Perilla frutescens var. frutescens]